MGIYTRLVQRVLNDCSPELAVETVHLLDAEPKGPRERVLAITQARIRMAKLKADVIHLLDGSYGYLLGSRLSICNPKRLVVTVHDLIPALQDKGAFPGTARPGWAAKQLIQSSLRVMKRARSVVTVSHTTAEDLKHLCGRQTDAVLLNPLRELPKSNLDSLVEVRKPFVLHVGSNAFYKNRRGVIEAFAHIADQHPGLSLVMAGAHPDQALMDRVTILNLTNRVHWISNPTDQQLAVLYSKAAVFLFPSLYEGFGWPVLEAMHYRCGVVCSDTPALAEVCGSAALLANPHDPAALGDATHKLLSNTSLRSEMIRRGSKNLERFSTTELAHGLTYLYHETAKANKRIGSHH